jgi:hypothetical protein
MIVNRDSFTPGIVGSHYVEPKLPEPDSNPPKARAELNRDWATSVFGPLRQGLCPGVGMGACGAVTPVVWAIRRRRFC